MIGMTFWQYGVSVPEVLIYLYISERFKYLPTYVLHVWPGICIIVYNKLVRDFDLLRNHINFRFVFFAVLIFKKGGVGVVTFKLQTLQYVE